jgi:serine/threonine protein kinase
MFEAEWILNSYLSQSMDDGCKVIHLLRAFFHGDHPCLVFELVAHSVLCFLGYLDSSFVGLPLPLVKKIIRDTLEALAFMHSCGVIHTDLKPENVLSTRPLFPYSGAPSAFHCLDDDPFAVDFKLGDLGNSCHTCAPVNGFIQTRQYRAPEVLLRIPYDETADIWSCGCMAFELATKNYLFDPRLDGQHCPERNNICDALHLSMIEKVLGPIPVEWAQTGAAYGDLYEDGELVAGITEESTNLLELLIRSGVSTSDAPELAEFLALMLEILPCRRMRAAELLKSPWLHHV